MNIKNRKEIIIISIIGVVILSMIIVLSLLSLNGARITTYDMKRIFNIRDIQSALQLYYSDVKHYPEQLDFDKPLKFNDTIYINNPMPTVYSTYTGRGFCPKDFKMQYLQKDNGQSYQILFCIDNITWGINAGYHVVSPQIKINDLQNKTKN
jgi:type II secretory pathway pseudopilin PulG